MSDKLNLYQKIQAVSMEVMNIEKDMQVGKGTYAYKAVSDNAVTLAVKRAEEKHKLISIPVNQELVSSEVLKTLSDSGDKEKVTYVENIKMTLRIIDLENTESYIDVESFGKGVDPGDKGFGKASTYARKYALLNAYKIATGEDPDADKSNEEKTQKTVSDKKKAVFDYLNDRQSAKVEIMKHFNVQSLEDLNESEVKTIYDTYKKKGLV